MSSCQTPGNTRCSSTDQSDSGGGSQLGTWIGTAIGAWIALLIIIWFLRTFINKTRRERFLHKTCIWKKTTGEQHPPEYRSKPNRRPANEVVYYTPSLPPSYSEIMRRPAQIYLPSSPDSEIMRQSVQFYLPSSPDRVMGGQTQFYLPTSPNGFHCFPGHFQFCIPCNGFLSSRLNKCRRSLSTLSISLPPIQEDVEISEPTTPTSNTPDNSDTVTLDLRTCQHCSHCPALAEHIQQDTRLVGDSGQLVTRHCSDSDHQIIHQVSTSDQIVACKDSTSDQRATCKDSTSD